jgi:hypothetical protein
LQRILGIVEEQTTARAGSLVVEKGSESCGQEISSGSFAALRMTARTYNGKCNSNRKGNGKCNSNRKGNGNGNDNDNSDGKGKRPNLLTLA